MSNKIRIRSLGRVISSLDDFDLYGVAGMVIGGTLTVFWSTGIEATSKIEYSVDDSSLDSSIELEGLRKYHSIPFPTTFVDSYHYFRVISTNPATGETKTSDTYRVYVTDTVILQSNNISTAINLDVINIDKEEGFIQELNAKTIPRLKFEDITIKNILTQGNLGKETVDKNLSTNNQKTTMNTNYTLTVE